MTSETLGSSWRDEGNDPEDGGWSFDGGGAADGYTLAYECGSRGDALIAGVTTAVLDRYEQDGGQYAPEYGLFAWLQDHDELFRPL